MTVSRGSRLAPRIVNSAAVTGTLTTSRYVPGCTTIVRPSPSTASTAACTESPGRTCRAGRAPRVSRVAAKAGAAAAVTRPPVRPARRVRRRMSAALLPGRPVAEEGGAGRRLGLFAGQLGPVLRDGDRGAWSGVAVLGEPLVLPGIGVRHVGVGRDGVDAGTEAGLADDQARAGGGVGAGHPRAGQLVGAVGGLAADPA